MKNLVFVLLALIGVYSAESQNFVINDSCFVFQPDAEAGMDAQIYSNTQFGYDTLNGGQSEDFCATAWTRQSYPSNIRSLIKFNMYPIQSSSQVVSARLSLYFNPTSLDGTHSSLTGLNSSTLQRIISYWDENTVTYVNQPATTTQNAVFLNPSISATQNFIDIDVTQLVKDDLDNPLGSQGFLFRLIDEQYYRKLVFSSSDHPTDSLRPKLEICLTGPLAIHPKEVDFADILMFPNPAKDVLSFDFQNHSSSFSVQVYSIIGDLLIQKNNLGVNNNTLNISGLSAGTYVVAIRSENGVMVRKKLLVL